MVQVQSPIGKLITLSYKEPETLGNTPLRIKLENLVDLLKVKIETKGLEQTESMLREDLFDLRLELLDFLKTHPDVLGYLEGKIFDELGDKYFQKGKHKALGEVVADTLEVYLYMFQQFADIMKANNEDLSGFDRHNMPSLSSLKQLSHLQPNPDIDLIVKWIESSITYDFYLIVAENLIQDEISLSVKAIELLKTNLKKAIIDFGVYSVMTNFWHPKPEDESPLIRNVKIKAAALKMNQGKYFDISTDSIQQLLLN